MGTIRYIYNKDFYIVKVIEQSGLDPQTTLSRGNNGGLVVGNDSNNSTVTYSVSDMGITGGGNGWWLDNVMTITNDAGESPIKSRFDISGNKYIEFTNKPNKITVKDSNGVILGFRDISDYLVPPSNWSQIWVYGVSTDKIMVLMGSNIYIYKYEISDDSGGENEGGGGNSNQITSIIFLAEGSPKPSGFTRVEDEIYKKTTANYEVLMYVVYYKPPATIGNINIQ